MRILVVNKCLLNDEAEYSCEVRTARTSGMLTVLGKAEVFLCTHICFCKESKFPVLQSFFFSIFPAEEEAIFTKNLANIDVNETDTIKLVCEVSKPGAEVIWYKGDDEIIETGRFEILTDGRKRILVIQNAHLEDAGDYNCRLPSSRTDGKVKVHGMKITINNIFKNSSCLLHFKVQMCKF